MKKVALFSILHQKAIQANSSRPVISTLDSQVIDRNLAGLAVLCTKNYTGCVDVSIHNLKERLHQFY